MSSLKHDEINKAQRQETVWSNNSTFELINQEILFLDEVCS